MPTRFLSHLITHYSSEIISLAEEREGNSRGKNAFRKPGESDSLSDNYSYEIFPT